MPSDPIDLESNGLYIVISNLGYDRLFHWGLYLATSPNEGLIYHLVGQVSIEETWYYRVKYSTGVPFAQELLLAFKIGVLDPALHEPMAQRLLEVPQGYSTRFGGRITSRIWVKEALYLLDQEGYIKLTADVNEIEAEAVDLASWNQPRDARTVARCSNSIE
jgi:hypothetical protein